MVLPGESAGKETPDSDQTQYGVPPIADSELSHYSADRPTVTPHPDSTVDPNLTRYKDLEPDRSPLISAARRFADYDLIEEIGRGGMGVVWKALDSKLNRFVAVKRLLSGFLASKDTLDRFQMEARAAARLEHPVIFTIFEVGERDGQFYYVMPFVEGGNLAARLRAGPLTPFLAGREPFNATSRTGQKMPGGGHAHCAGLAGGCGSPRCL